MITTLLMVTGCGSDEPEVGSGPTPEPGRIELTFEGDDAPPTERVQVEPGEEIELVIRSDDAGELHVHSEPGQILPYAAGTTSLKLTIDAPGVVDVERHEPEALVLQLEVG
ncbi:MAG: hypothetical protein ACXWDL_13310 [Nocardioides sp.]